MIEVPLPRQGATAPTAASPNRAWWSGRGLVGLGAGVAVVLALTQTGLFTRSLVNPGGWPLAWRFLGASVAPTLTPDFVGLTLQATLVTLGYAVCGTSLSLVIGVVGGVLSSERWWQAVGGEERLAARYRALWAAIRAGLAMLRGVHEIIWGLFFVNIFGLDPLTAILAIAIPFGAITAKVFSELLDETPAEPLRSLVQAGAPPLTALLYALLPPALPNLLSYAFYRFECSIRSAALLGIIGAGGLGYQLLLSFQSLRYHEMWTFIYALVLLNGAIDLWSSSVRRRMGGANRLDLALSSAPRGAGRPERDPVLRASVVVVALLIPFSFWLVQPDVGKLVAPRSAALLVGVVQLALPPSLKVGLAQMLALTWQTLAISILAITIAAVGGLLLSVLGAGNLVLPGGILDARAQSRRPSVGHVVLWLTRALLLVFRAIPPPVWALNLRFFLLPGSGPAALALGLYTLGILGRLTAEVIEELDERPLRALAAQGAPGPAVLLYGVLPATLPRFVAYVLYRWEVCARETAVIGVVGVGGLGRLLAEQFSGFDYRGVVTTLIFFMALTVVVDLLSAAARRALR